MSGTSGWFTVKKRGRDDEEIERDRKIALERRRQHRKSSATKPATINKTTTQTLLKRRPGGNKKKRSSLDSLDSDDDFIVEDDDDEEEEIDDSFIDDDDDEEGEGSFVDEDDSDDEHEKEPSKKRAAVKASKHAAGRSTLERDDYSSSDSIEEANVSSFFPKIGKKLPASKAIPLPSQRGIAKGGAMSKKSIRSISVKANPLAKFAYKENRIKAQPNNATMSNQNVVSLENSDSDNDLDSKSLSRVTGTTTARSKKLKDNFDGDDDDSSDTMSASKLRNSIGARRSHPSDQCFTGTLRELEDTPLVPQAIRKKKLKRYQPPSDKPASTKQQQRNTEKKKLLYETKNVDDNDYCSDIDEAIAIACAIEESTKSMKTADKKTKPDKKKTAATTTIYLTDPSDDDEEDDGKENARNEEMIADYVNVDDEDDNDEDALAAKSILETAKELSRRILRTMAGWSHTAMDGIIVDGALALSTISNNDNTADPDRKMDSKGAGKTGDHEWISNETMVQILPNVKLSEYQLIGVNWIALLHGMKCEVEGAKKHTNVNGILADGKI